VKYLILLVPALLALAPLIAHADDTDEALAKQKSAAAANWKKMEFAKDAGGLIETPNLLIYSRQPEAKTKLLGASLEKVMAVALKALQYDAMDRPWPGKLAVYILPERGEFVEFMRKVIRKSPGESDISHGSVSGDVAQIVVGAPRAGTSEPDESARLELAHLLLQRKLGGAEPPEWLSQGFAKASNFRASNKTGKAAAPPAYQFKDLWNENLPLPLKTRTATFFVDYLAYGPAADVFPAFVGALRPEEGGGMPSVKTVLEAIKMDQAGLELYARNWKKPPAPKAPIKPKDKPKPDK
jgi:hypothetical protein